MKLPLTASWVDSPFRYTIDSSGGYGDVPMRFFVVLHVLIPPYRPMPPYYTGENWWQGIVWKKLDTEEITLEPLDWAEIASKNPSRFATPAAARSENAEARGVAWAEKNWPYAVYDSMEGGC